LIELGCHPLDAINRVRAARPGMLGSAALADYLRRLHRPRLNAVAPLELLDRGIVIVDPRTALRRRRTTPCPVVRAETHRGDWSSQSRYQTRLLESRVMRLRPYGGARSASRSVQGASVTRSTRVIPSIGPHA
jgi:hypothetical protein